MSFGTRISVIVHDEPDGEPIKVNKHPLVSYAIAGEPVVVIFVTLP